jgi:hypothetical protein
MSADGSPRPSFVPNASCQEQKATTTPSCGVFDLPIPYEESAVLLTSGRSLPFKCYIELRQRPPELHT